MQLQSLLHPLKVGPLPLLQPHSMLLPPLLMLVSSESVQITLHGTTMCPV